MDMSLDEIIKKKKIGSNAQSARRVPSKTFPGKVFPKSTRVQDARLKIIAKNRSKIRDARDKLTEIARTSSDARLRLDKKQALFTAQRRARSASILRSRNTRYPSVDIMADIIKIPRGYVDYDNMDRMEDEKYDSHLARAVKNELAYKAFRNDDPRGPLWDSNGNDPFELYNIPLRHTSDLSPSPPLDVGARRTVRHISPDRMRTRPIRDISPSYGRRYIPLPSSHLSYEMRSRLEHAPNRHLSMGIFSNPLSPQKSHSSSGYRIVVSNLNPNVTEGDIRELFEDLGDLYDSHLVRPGIAEVAYKTLSDAEKAVDTYHNRQLDGQPMKCLLVNPRPSGKPTAPAMKLSSNSSSRTTSGKTPLEIDIDALHKVLFRRK